MGGKKLKTSAGEGLTKPAGLSNRKKNKEEYSEKISKIVESDENLHKQKEEKKKPKSSEKKRRNSLDESNIEGEAIGEKKKSKLKNKKRRKESIIDTETGEVDEASNKMENTQEKKEMEGKIDEQNSIEAGEKTKKAKKKKRKNEKMKKADINEVDELYNEVEDGSAQGKGKSKKARKMKRKEDKPLSKNDEKKAEAEEEYEVYKMSSGDEDSTAGMKKWVKEYHESRPGLEILQQRIDDFITAHEAQEEQARKEREARIAEDGFTTVVHHKGRKKTTDSESGVAVGSVAQAAVMDKLSKKKIKDVGLDFYRFQKHEAQRNEIMMLQSKFEQDKKRIQQLRAARKFRPY